MPKLTARERAVDPIQNTEYEYTIRTRAKLYWERGVNSIQNTEYEYTIRNPCQTVLGERVVERVERV